MMPNEQLWRTVLGDHKKNLDLTYTLTNVELLPSQRLKARFRCENSIGFSDWSNLDYLLMAGVPKAPPKPSYISSTDSTIII